MVNFKYLNKVFTYSVVLIALSFCNSGASAETFTPTLDSLAGQPIEGTNPVEYYPSDLKSGYTVTLLENATPNNLPENAITIYDLNPETHEITPQYYAINLVQTDYGHKDNYDSVKYFKFETDANGNKTFAQGAETDFDIRYFVDSSRLGNRISSNQNGADIDKDFVDRNAGSCNSAAASCYRGGAINLYTQYSTVISHVGTITGDF